MRNKKFTEGLYDLINYVNKFSETKNMNMIEIGSYAGESTKIFSEHFKTVLSIDPYLNDYDVKDPACSYMDLNNVYYHFIENTKNLNNITHIRKKSDDAILNIKDLTFDFVYIDGLHTKEQVEKDIINYLPHIKSNHYIGGHDYHTNWPDVIEIVNKFFGKPDMVFKDSSWIKKI